MESLNSRRFYSLHADANALGGYVGEPVHKPIPTVAPASLASVGGLSTARSDGFNLEDVISVGAAYTRVSGSQLPDGSLSILVTSALENLNILDLLTARRIVTQVAISVSGAPGELRFSLAGSQFDGLRIAGRDCRPKLNEALTRSFGDGDHCTLPLTRDHARESGQVQAESVVRAFQGRAGTSEWVKARQGWMSDRTRTQDGLVLCSLIDAFSDEHAGHIADIPGFGRFILGEVCVSSSSVYATAVRAELGCRRIEMRAVAGSGGGSGVGNPD